MNWGAEGHGHCPGSALPVLSWWCSGPCRGAARHGPEPVQEKLEKFSFYFVKWFKSTTGCLMALEGVKT